MYAVLKNDTCALRYVEAAGNHLILRPHNQSSAMEVMVMEEGKSAPDRLVGGICHIGMEAKAVPNRESNPIVETLLATSLPPSFGMLARRET